MNVQIVDPSAYTPPYDHALCSALAELDVNVELVTSSFGYGQTPDPVNYSRNEFFYRHALGKASSKLRAASKGLEHIPDMVRYRHHAQLADIVHFQWLAMQPVDRYLLPSDRPTVLTAHDVLPREPRPGTVSAQRRLYETVDAVVVHSRHGRQRLISELEIDPQKISVIEHGAFEYLTEIPRTLPRELEDHDREKAVVLVFGLLRPYKGLDLLLEAWDGLDDAELWVVGMPRMPVKELMERAPKNVKFVPRFVTDSELAACFERADVVTLPYREIDQSGVLYTALAFGKPLVLSDIGGFSEVADHGAAKLFPAGDVAALSQLLERLLVDAGLREQLSQAATNAAKTTYSWTGIASRTVDLYRSLII